MVVLVLLLILTSISAWYLGKVLLLATSCVENLHDGGGWSSRSKKLKSSKCIAFVEILCKVTCEALQ